jgi:hypothetical protein
MMNDIDKIFGALRSVQLSDRERKNMKLHLETHMRENPVRAGFSERLRNRFIGTGQYIDTALNSRVFVTHPAFAACVLVLCVGLGTSYAAENSLPGQALYSFKTRVNEPLEGALALTPQAKAEWSAELTNRRLQEAEELAATNSLSPVATADIETGLDTALQNFNTSVALVAKNDDADAANAQTDLEASLNAHETVLATLPTQQKNNADHITSLVRKHVSKINNDRSSAIASFTATDSPEVHAAAIAQQKDAEDAITRVQLLSTNTTNESVASSVVSVAQSASDDVDVGNSDAKKGHWGKAYGAFQDATRKAKETQDSVDTRKWLKVRFNIGLDDGATTTPASNSGSQDDNSDPSSNSDSSGDNSGDNSNDN